MKEITDYDKVFETLVQKTQDYVVRNNLNCMVLGISGGIDSTVVAAICREVSDRTGIPLIGRSLPSKFNKEGETITANLVGKAFCDDYKEVYSVSRIYDLLLASFILGEETMKDNFHTDDSKLQTPIANGNIQARLRMMYLYNLASIHRGLVMDTDNLTENNLGYFTIHGDVGDFNPIGGLWKTEVFKLAEYLQEQYSLEHCENIVDSVSKNKTPELPYKVMALEESLKLKPTAGLGITDSDLDEIGAESYDQVDRVLKCLTDSSVSTDTIDDIPDAILEAVVKRHNASKFKRKQLPIKITRDEILV